MSIVVYGETFYCSTSLINTVPLYVSEFRELLEKDKNIVGVVSTGSSGTVIATALLMQTHDRELFHLHVNKPNASSHSGNTAGWNKPKGNYVFVDDFIYTGESFMRCYNGMKVFSGCCLKYALVGFASDNYLDNTGVEIVTLTSKM